MAAAFGSSIWVGGVTFALAAAMAGFYAAAVSERRGRLIARAALALGIALAAASPILIEQARAAAERSGGPPVAFHAYEVFGPSVADAIRRPLDLIGFWPVQLPVDLPATFPIGVAALAAALATAGGDPGRRRVATVLALGAAASFAVSWLLVSKILNNDLGWRAVLPGTLVLAAFAAAGLSRWTARPTKAVPSMLAIACVLAGAYGGFFFFRDDLAARPSGSAAAFARSPELWREARAHSGLTERIASNPGLFADMTQHPINISWALLSDRRSCYAGWEFARPFSGKSAEEVDRTDTEFRAVFDGTASASAVHALFEPHDCSVIVVTAADGAWASGAFAKDPAFELLNERPGAWRIYRFLPTRPPP
ncbi:hypothetical protein [Chenggangzhangella methanolivorans]|uniref:Uncharacterized protein n=1 Tax=Chenggangzhangella methanolivorans TaxID=1437009 RepID=A0A9E6RD22_9HYPH|nr:hypothetical protein [Chenggangzhangella methanolivorans]QZO02110.1 hypothetical protein K6K41_13065 [Chenggangzhangella methanolivorans]